MFIRKIKKKSETYLAKVESYRDKEEKIKQRVIQYLGEEMGDLETESFKYYIVHNILHDN